MIDKVAFVVSKKNFVFKYEIKLNGLCTMGVTQSNTHHELTLLLIKYDLTDMISFIKSL